MVKKRVNSATKSSFYLSFFAIFLWGLINLGKIPKRIYFLLIQIPSNFYSSVLFSKKLLKKSKLKNKHFSSRIKSSAVIILNTLGFEKMVNIFKFTKKKRRGRPRTQPLIPYLWQKWEKFINFVFPKSLRIAALAIILILSFFFYSVFLVEVAHQLPSPERLSDNLSPATTEFYDRNNTLLYRLYEGKNRELTKIDTLPSYLIQATIAIEDKNFYAHQGVDLAGIIRAVFNYAENLIRGGNSIPIQGGSTITQQLIKNTLLTPERSIDRKAKEIILSFWAERIFSKKEILQMYFNESPYGGPAWGIEAASLTYFGKHAKDLTLSESAYLAGLPASPTTYSPYGANPKLGKNRQAQVLRRMVEDGYIKKEVAEKSFAENLKINPPTQSIKAPHFVMYVRNVLAQKYGEKVVSQGGLKIITTLDLKLQGMAENAVAEEIGKLSTLNVGNGAAMITDAKTGQILSMVGSKNYWDLSLGNFNVATALRQPGSSIKPITYAESFKQGFSPGNILQDSPISFKNDWEVYSPVNYDGKFHGPVSIRTALGSSYNIPAVKMLSIVGIDNMIKTAHDLGITTLNDRERYGLSLTLGGGEVKLIDMMTVYGTFSQLGIRHDTQSVLKVTDNQGIVLEDNTDSQSLGKRVLEEGVAYFITDILKDNNARAGAFGPNSLLNIPGREVAVKTGTTDSKRDNWTFGYTPEVVVGVWVGNNNNEPMHPQLTSGITGAAPIWNKIMNNLLSDSKITANSGNGESSVFKKPDSVVTGIVDGKRDLVLVNQPLKSLRAKDSISFTDPLTPVKIDKQNSVSTP